MSGTNQYLKFLVSLTVLFISCQLTIFSQDKFQTEVVKGDVNACELNSLHLDKLKSDWLSGDLKERIFVIARLGNKEKSRRLNLLRLTEAKFFTVGKGQLPKENVVFAEGEKAKGDGRIEFYLGSQLFLVSLAPLNKNVCFACCDDNPLKPKTKR